MDDKALWKLIASLSLAQKAALCSGADFWQTKANEEKGIPALRMADGPHGLRYEEVGKGARSREATCFPSACALACSFSPQLLEEVGAAIAKEAEQNGVGLLLGPGVNMKRSPLCGRNFEYYAEDPLLAGVLAAAFISGVQKNGVGACIKHFAANNQEYLRSSINVAVDDRALFDFYLRAFEIAVQAARPAAVMTSYNRLQGEYTANNRRLLFDILRLRFAYSGAVISDWGGEYNRVAGIMAGLDLEMPASGNENEMKIERAIQYGALDSFALDTACFNLLRLVFRYAKPAVAVAVPPPKEHHALAVKALVQSAVLLKNEGQLPLCPGRSLAVIGEMAEKSRFQGAGSSLVYTQQVSSFRQALEEMGMAHVYSVGYQEMRIDDNLVLQAAQTAKQAQDVVLFLGLPSLYESEGFDREDIQLPQNQLQVLKAVCAASDNVCVVLCCGSPVSVSWPKEVKSVLCLYLGGEGLGEAAVQLLFGKENPAGKLAETWPLAVEDTPCYHSFPMGPNEVCYRESLYVGYRYYNTAQKEVQYPFGHGLSYTSFSYECTQRLLPQSKKEVCFALWLKNTGKVAGEEVVQVYAAAKDSRVYRPAQELVCFERVAMQPKEEKCVVLHIPMECFAVYDVVSKRRVVEGGDYELQIGSSSRDIRLRCMVHLQGVSLQPNEVNSASGPYGIVRDNQFSSEAFEDLYGRPLQGNIPPKKGFFTDTTPLGQMQESIWGRIFLGLASCFARKETYFSANKEVNEKVVWHVMRDMPLKNIPMQSQGRVSQKTVEAMLRLCNAEGSVMQLMKSLANRNKKRKNNEK